MYMLERLLDNFRDDVKQFIFVFLADIHIVIADFMAISEMKITVINHAE